MRNNVIPNNITYESTVSNEILKVTALLYLKDALVNEQYEYCSELMEAAKGFGAQQSEVRDVIAEYLNGDKVGQNNKADQEIGGRLRF